MLALYQAAKNALAHGTNICRTAEQKATSTEEALHEALAKRTHASYLRDALHEQVHTLSLLAHAFRSEMRAGQATCDDTFKELDELDAQLNEALADLKRTRLPRILAPSQRQQAGSIGSDISDSHAVSRSKTLFDFADEHGVEQLKGDLRQAIDDLQENQEQLVALYEKFDAQVRTLDKVLARLPAEPVLLLSQVSEEPDLAKSSKAMTLSRTTEACKKQQSEHLEALADMLLSLSQHYDHSCKLIKSDTSLQSDEREELKEVVEHDALQLDDVLADMEERLGDIEEDLRIVSVHLTDLDNVCGQIEEAFSGFEALDVQAPVNEFDSLRASRETRESTVEMRREQLLGLGQHFAMFSKSYDALLLEIDRRAHHDAAVNAFLDQTRRQLNRLRLDEVQKRDAFLQMHGDSLPEDIWDGIRDAPAGVTLIKEEGDAPVLSQSVLQAARARHAQRARETSATG